MAAVQSPAPIPLGASVPAFTSHAISVSLPSWADNVDYEEGKSRVVDVMTTGYPRFFIHLSIQKLGSICLAKFGRAGESAMLFPSSRIAAEARDFLAARPTPVASRIVEFVVCPGPFSLPTPPAFASSSTSSAGSSGDSIELQILFFDQDHFSDAKQFWQHTGDGISSRLAERVLAYLGEQPAGVDQAGPAPERRASKVQSYTRNKHYSRQQTAPRSVSPTNVTHELPAQVVPDEVVSADLSTFLEERYGRNLPLAKASVAKQAMKRRIAGGLAPSDQGFGQEEDVARGAAGGSAVTEDDVYLYPCGMSAIWHAFDISRRARRARGEKEGISYCYGFPYTDTLKILQKWGPGCHFFGRGGDLDIPDLEEKLASHDPAQGKVLSLFCEFPSNPLLRSPDLARIRQLADEYGFVVVVDETIGNFMNVEIMPFADVVVSSLSKIFSGDANVLGGSLILNPNSSHYTSLKRVLNETYEDNFFSEDAVYMERNSRDYRPRIERINNNAYDVTEYLHSRSLGDISTPADGKVIDFVYYPRYSTPKTYEAARRLPTLGRGGYGGLFSLTFTSLEASKAFFDSLECAKGPSLGTSFTLASPYTILAHYLELDWAAGFGVPAGLVRISVGEEDGAVLSRCFRHAVAAAEAAGAAASR